MLSSQVVVRMLEVIVKLGSCNETLLFRLQKISKTYFIWYVENKLKKSQERKGKVGLESFLKGKKEIRKKSTGCHFFRMFEKLIYCTELYYSGINPQW